eukprot:gene6412-11852_t
MGKEAFISGCMGPSTESDRTRGVKMDNNREEDSHQVHLQELPTSEEDGKLTDSEDGFVDNTELLYTIDENPPWYIALCLGFQHYLTMFGATFALPFVLSVPLCYAHDPVVISNIINTIFFASGLATLLQSTIGVRLPIVQGGTFTFVAPTIAIMSLRGPCPEAVKLATTARPALNLTTTASVLITSMMPNSTATGSHGSASLDEEWKIRMREIQGAIMVSALAQVFIGFSGLMGLIIRFIGPLTIVPTIALVGLPLFETAYYFASAQWGIALLMIFFITLFSQVIKDYKFPFPFYSKGKCTVSRWPIFKLFPIMISIFITWSFSAILTAAGAFDPGHRARTDNRLAVLEKVPWFRVPYPGQWGTPTISVAAVVGMLAGVIGSMVESIGDYFACARIAGAPPPPHHAINRGLGMEGIGCILTGAWGTGNGTTSYSENIGAIGITRVGSRRVIQFGAMFMLVLAVIGKFGALFTTIPDPVIGGIFIVMFGMITAVGLGTLQYADLNSMRNLFVLGNSLFFGMVLPFWVKRTPKAINTGSVAGDQIITVLLSTNMAVGGITGFILDNLLPGTLEERGIHKWRSLFEDDGKGASNRGRIASIHTYDIPLITQYLQKFPAVKYIPFLPYYGKLGQPQGVDTYRKTSVL